DEGPLPGMSPPRPRRDVLHPGHSNQPAAEHRRSDRPRGPGPPGRGHRRDLLMMRGAILGVGNVAINGHLPGWLAREDVEITAAADPRPAGLEALLARVPAARWYDTPRELLSREELDFV